MSDTRHEELAAQATRVQVRPGGLITDYFGCGPSYAERYGDRDPREVRLHGDGSRMALVRCVHGNEWPEGGNAADGTCVSCVSEYAERRRAEVRS